jgi:thiol-disulfide isomerase/thioredoxin
MNTISPIQYPRPAAIRERMASGKPSVLVFMSEWCPACQEFKPIVEFFAEKYEGMISVFVVRPENLGDLPGILPEGRIQSIPYTLFVLGKTLVGEVPGALRFYDFASAMETLRHLGPAGS